MSSATTEAEIADWRIVAPWYRWEHRDHPSLGGTDAARRPSLHKYVSTDFMETFLKDPQRSVVFDGVRDVVQVVRDVPDPHGVGVTADPADPPPQRSLTTVFHEPRADGLRKLFLPAHQRYYLAVVDIHCDTPGFPKVDPDKIAEVGMVIRRCRPEVDSTDAISGFVLARDVAQSRMLTRTRYALDAAKARSRVLHPFAGRKCSGRIPSPSAATLAAAQETEMARRKLATWATDVGVGYERSGWVPTGEGTFGEWVPMADCPGEVIERSYPMHRLSPSATDPDHAAHEGTIFYASLPTGSDEVTADGAGRFNDQDTYEIRVFARLDRGDCPGPIVWSEASHKFRLASFFDPDGLEQRPLEIRLPDFRDLEASSALPSVRMTTPEGSSLSFGNVGGFHDPGDGSVGGFQICFFSIPLITIVALFLLNIVLPIVLFVFNLWWMLKLKFCIPPSIDLAGGLDAAFELSPPEINLEAALSLEIDIDTDLRVTQGTHDAIAQLFVDNYNSSLDDPDWRIGDEIAGADPVFSSNALVQLAAATGAVSGDGPPDFTAGVTYHQPVTRDQVVAPGRVLVAP